eukprot:TRINITY_DN2332_c7_g1_i1.p1 TRINITY_DN2332_c7_g1~~TRINITY_DN2332_c7_g1_i1.p1  ORF type:complete len:236 (-),score=84.16 TRINITY_DN2332_c7_g1_i1:308-1015(-)
MKAVVEYLQKRGEEQKDHPILLYMRDTSIPTKDRVSKWLFSSVFWIMGFGDICNHFLRYPDEEAATDKLKAALNRHCKEDGEHNEWLQKDLAALGVDGDVSTFSQALRTLYCPGTIAQRKGVANMQRLCIKHSDPVLRYVIIESIEVFGNKFFKAACDAGAQYEKETGKELIYLGPHHFAAEQGHLAAQHDDADEAMFEEAVLTEEQRKDAMIIAKEIVDNVILRWDEYYAATQV